MKSKKYLVLAALPILAGMVLKILTNVPAEGISISGAHIYFTIPMPLQDLPITEAQVNSWLVIASLFFLCRYLTSDLTVRGGSVRQMLAEWIVEKTEGLVMENMGSFFAGFAPFVGAILGLSALSSLLTLVGLFPPTSDLNISAGWALAVFILITHYKLKGGPGQLSQGFYRADSGDAPHEYHWRAGYAGGHGLPALWQHSLWYGDLRAGVGGAAGPEQAVFAGAAAADRLARRVEYLF